MLKKSLIGLGLVIVLLIAAVVIVPMFIPVETYKAEIAKQVKSATGREFEIAGDVSVTVFPVLGLEVNDVTFGNAKGASTPAMLKLSRMVIALKVMPLIGGQIVVDRFVLENPVINLEIAKNGKPNWEFQGGAAAAAGKKPEKKAAPAKPAAGGSFGFDINELKLGEVALINGRVTYLDRRSGQKIVLSNIYMDLKLPGIAEPMVAEGRATWNKQEVKLVLDLKTPKSMLAGKKTAVGLTIASAPVNLSFNGSVTAGKILSAGGPVKLDVPSVRNLAAWTGNPLQFAGNTFGPLKIEGMLGMAGSTYKFSKAKIAFDDIRGEGSVTFKGGGKVPYVNAVLVVEKLDLNPYLPPEQKTTVSSAGGAASGSSAGAAAPKQAQQWSDEKIDLRALRAINADLSFKSGPILVRKIKVDRGALKIALKGGRLQVDLTDLSLYKGKGSGTVVVDASGATLGIQERFSLSGIQARPLLTDAAGIDWLEGGGGFSLKVAGRGNSQRQIVRSLNGNGSFKFLDGAVHGMNIGKIVRTISEGFKTGGVSIIKALASSKSMGAEKTDFASLTGTFTIKNGVLTNKDMALLNPLVRVTGAGQSNLNQRNVDYRVEARIVATAKGQGGDQDLKGLVIPVRISGPWHDVKSEVSVKAILKAMLTKDIGKTVKGLIGGKLPKIKMPKLKVPVKLPGKLPVKLPGLPAVGKLIPGLPGTATVVPKPAAPVPAAPVPAAKPKPEPKPEDIIKKGIEGLFKN